MKQIRLLFLLTICFVTVASFQSCKKDDVTVVDGNQAPPDNTIENLVYTNYVNKAYIALLGREPDATERQAALNTIFQGSLSMDSRRAMLLEILDEPDFLTNIYQQAGDDLLNGYDTTVIYQYENALNIALQDSAYVTLWADIQLELDKLTLLRQIPDNLYSGNLTVKDMHRRMINNYVYDQLNMGTENFVISMFDHFFLRLPTVAELSEGKNMVDGLNAIVFLQEGDNKNLFMDYFFDHQEYYEGQIRQLYQKYLFRDPTNEETTQLSLAYKTSGSYSDLLVSILSTDEYVGL